MPELDDLLKKILWVAVYIIERQNNSPNPEYGANQSINDFEEVFSTEDDAD